MKQPKFRKSILAATAAACGCAAIWSLPTMAAQDQTTTALQQQIQQLDQKIDQLQSQSQQLGQQVQQLEKKQKSAATATATATATTATAAKPESKNKTYLGGAFYLNYGRYSNSYNGSQPGSGDGGFSYMSLNANGNYGKLTWGFDERIGPSGQIADKELLHLAWVGYDFDKSNSMTAGFFQVPFGNYPYGYDVYWGSMGYYLGFNDNQALGASYTFKKGAWRWDLDAFKNYDAGQNSLYAGNPFQEYRMVDTGNTRLSYTFGKGTSNTVDVSGSFRGGHLEVGGQPSHYGTHWAGAVAADAELGPWSLRGQVVMYKYNVPAGRLNSDKQAISRNSILMEDYGFESARIPAAGVMYTVDLARTIKVKGLGPIDSFQPFLDMGYLQSRSGSCDSSVDWSARESSANLTCAGGKGYRMGDIATVTPGFITNIGPLVLWTEIVYGKNQALRFIGPNNNEWHLRYNFEAAYYFGGNVL